MRRLLCVLAALLYAGSLLFAERAEKTGNGIVLVLDGSVSAAEAAELGQREQAEEAPTGFCFYSILEAETVRCPETGRSAQAAVVPLYGNGALLGAEALSWQVGAMPDRQTARDLFGTDRVEHQQLSLRGKTWEARGTAAFPTPTVLVTAEGDTALESCVLAGWSENGTQAAEQFLLRHGLTGQTLNFYPLLVFVKNLSLLPLWALLAVLCGRIRNRRLRWLAFFAGAVLLGSRVVIPKDAIPSMWSDFSFWGSWFQSQRENLRAILLARPSPWALQMEQNMVQSMICALAGTLAMVWGGRRERCAAIADRG